MEQVRPDRLTVMITTYNRKERLCNVISSLNRNQHFGEYDILIVDNCSPDYNWDELLNMFDERLRPYVQIERRSFNCGMSCNISSCFLLVKTKWCLYISDDDHLLDNAIGQVLKDAKEYSNYCAVKYTLLNWPIHKNCTIYNIKDYIGYFSNYRPAGDNIYLSMLYNLDALGESLILNTSFGYTYVGFLFPVIDTLINGGAPMKLSSESIIEYVKAAPGTNWNYLSVVLGLCTLFDIPLQITYRQKKDLYRTMVVNFRFYTILDTIWQYAPKDERNYFYKKIYFSLLYPLYPLKSFLGFRIPALFHSITGIDIYKLFGKKHE